MALSLILCKYSKQIQRTAMIRMCSNRVITLEVDTIDVIDNFTSDLVQKKLTKWDHAKLKRKFYKQNDKVNAAYNLTKPICLDVDIESLNGDELDVKIQNIMGEGNKELLENVINECILHHKCPSLLVIMDLLPIFSLAGDVEVINKIKELAKNNIVMYKSNAEFDHYLAEALWMKGNLNKSIELFDKVYRENIFMRRRVRLMFRYLVFDVTNKSEAVLIKLIKFSEKILLDFRDFFPLTCVWQTCFLSEWFTDHQTALDLLEKNNGLCKAVTNNVPFVVNTSLRVHQTDVVYRLLEIFLKYDMKLQYSMVLIALFDYRFRQGDLCSCSEIIRWSVEQNVTLPSLLHEQFLILLVDGSDYKKPIKVVKKLKYQYKF